MHWVGRGRAKPMKTKILLVLTAMIGSAVLSACDPGTMEYGYAYNPKGVLYKVFKVLKDGDVNDEWLILFSGKATCVYNSEEGIANLKKTIGNVDTALERFSLEQPVLVETGKKIKGFHDVMGTIIKGERYRARMTRKADGAPVFTAMISCFQENSDGSDHHYCAITDLHNHVNGNPVVPVCEVNF